MKVFLTGASGIFGSDMKAELERIGENVIGYDSKQINITDCDDLRKKIADQNPNVIIHAAALTNVDLCEEEHETAYQVNAAGTENLAICAQELHVPMVYISSCGVYGDDVPAPHSETDPLAPVNYHHYTKLVGENKLRGTNADHLIIRPGWLFGGTKEHKKNFVEARRKEAVLHPVLKSAVDKFGSPTYTLDLAKQIIRLIQSGARGTFNVANTGSASRLEYVTAIIDALNLDNRIMPVSSDEFPRKAAMPRNEMLANTQLNNAGLNIMRPWRTALKEYIGETYGIDSRSNTL